VFTSVQTLLKDYHINHTSLWIQRLKTQEDHL